MKRLITIFCLILCTQLAHAQVQEIPNIKCSAMRGQLSFFIIDQKLKIATSTDRAPASAPTLINRLRGETLTQVTYIQGQRHRIFVENIFDLEHSSNTVSLRSAQGHEITYPLNCKIVL